MNQSCSRHNGQMSDFVDCTKITVVWTLTSTEDFFFSLDYYITINHMAILVEI